MKVKMQTTSRYDDILYSKRLQQFRPRESSEGFSSGKEHSRSIFKQISNWAKGFRMTVGNPSTTTINGTKKGLAYTCLQTILTRGYETPDFPKEPCPAGIMAIQVRDDLSRCCNQLTDHKTVSVSSILICRALRSCMIFA